MTEEEGGREMLRAHTLGQVRASVERREALLDEFDRSGVSAAKFAALAGVNYQPFVGWVHKRRERRGAGDEAKKNAGAEAPGQVRWLEAVVDGSGASFPASALSSALWVHLPGGARLEIAGAGQVALAAECCGVWTSRVRTCRHAELYWQS